MCMLCDAPLTVRHITSILAEASNSYKTCSQLLHINYVAHILSIYVHAVGFEAFCQLTVLIYRAFYISEIVNDNCK